MTTDIRVEPCSERRRAERRRFLEQHAIVSARVRPGIAVSIVDVSAGGVLLETIHRLLPGTSVELLLEMEQGAASICGIRGRVLRCAIVRLQAGALWYRGAVGFDTHLSLSLDDAPPRETGSHYPSSLLPTRLG